MRKPPTGSYWFPKGRKNLNEKLLKERVETLEKSLAEQEALVAKMTSLREAAVCALAAERPEGSKIAWLRPMMKQGC